MEWGRILDGDSLFRHAIHPVSYTSKRFAQEKLLKLYDEPDGSLTASLAWERYVPTTKHIHGYGCRLALRTNDKKRAEGTFKEKSRHVYGGSYHLKAVALRALGATSGLSEISSADIVHEIEEGELAHANLRIFPQVGNSIDEGTKTAILDRFWNACSGPLKHKCDCDHDINPHPSVKLISPPAGAYIDSRSFLFRCWCIIRFELYNWVWCRFLKNSTQ